MEDTGYSEYEIERLKNIQRNEEYLKLMGFAKSTAVKPKPVVKRKKAEPVYIEPARRSSRVASLEPVVYTEPNVPSMYRNSDKIYFAHAETKPDIVDGDLDVGAISGIEVNIKSEVDGFAGTTGTAGSSSTMDADLSYFFGTALANNAAPNASGSTRKRVKVEGAEVSAASGGQAVPHRLCQPIDDYGKAAIMALSNHGTPPRFSKYVGALEWKNCVYLWVNLGGKSGYSNAFSEQGRHIMWFGGSKMHKDSHVIQRIARAAKPETIKTEDNKQSSPAHETETVVLFVRIEGENYCCLGRLQWVAIDLLASPVKVKWELMDYDLFCEDAHFKRLIA